MNYRYQKNQIFRKKLDVPKEILNKVYNHTLSFEEFIQYQLEDKIPIDCILEYYRQIVEKFGVEKCKKLDWELARKSAYKNILMSIDPQVEDLNMALYELIVDDLKPDEYSSKMKEAYKDKLFDIDKYDNEKLKKLITDYNDGYVSLKDMVDNWDLFKNKNLAYCLKKDHANKNNITEDMLRKFMLNFGDLAKLIIKYDDIYEFINNINNMSNDKQFTYVGQFSSKILNKIYNYIQANQKSNMPTNKEFKAMFNYCSLEDYLTLFNSYGAKQLISELKTLSKDYIFNIPIPFSELLNEKVLYLIGTFGIKNIVDFDNECGHFFTMNNYEMLKKMYDMYLPQGRIKIDGNIVTLNEKNTQKMNLIM